MRCERCKSMLITGNIHKTFYKCDICGKREKIIKNEKRDGDVKNEKNI